MKLNIKVYICITAVIVPLYLITRILKSPDPIAPYNVISRSQIIQLPMGMASLDFGNIGVEMKMSVDKDDIEYVIDRLNHPKGKHMSLLEVEPLMHNPNYCFTSEYHSPFDEGFNPDNTSSTRHGAFVPKSGWIPVDEKFKKNLTEKIDWIFYVHTAIKNYRRRQIIRKTWGYPRLFKDYNMRILFVVGKSEEVADQKRMDLEYSLYGDILQGDFIDTYKNLTYKAIFTLRWLTTYCSHVPMVMKADDDTFINIFHMKKHLIHYSNFNPNTDSDDIDNKEIKLLMNTPKTPKPAVIPTRTMICNIYDNNTMIILREKDNCLKWCVSKADLRNMTYFPRYCSGLNYFFTMPLVKRLYEEVKNTDFLWIDDVYVTGLLPLEIQNINYVNIKDDMLLDNLVVNRQYKNHSTPVTYHVTHVGDLERFAIIWNLLLKRLTRHEERELTVPLKKLKLKITML